MALILLHLTLITKVERTGEITHKTFLPLDIFGPCIYLFIYLFIYLILRKQAKIHSETGIKYYDSS